MARHKVARIEARLAAIMDPETSSRRAVGEAAEQIGQLRVAVLSDQPGHIIAAAPAAGPTVYMQILSTQVREGESAITGHGGR